MRGRTLLVAAAVGLLGSCSDGSDGVPNGQRARRSTTSTAESKVRLDAVYTCGPADGAIIEAGVSSPESVPVMVDLVQGEQILGESALTELRAGQPEVVGFDINMTRAQEEIGSGRVRVRPWTQDDQQHEPTASVTVSFEPPPDAPCLVSPGDV